MIKCQKNVTKKIWYERKIMEKDKIRLCQKLVKNSLFT